MGLKGYQFGSLPHVDGVCSRSEGEVSVACDGAHATLVLRACTKQVRILCKPGMTLLVRQYAPTKASCSFDDYDAYKIHRKHLLPVTYVIDLERLSNCHGDKVLHASLLNNEWLRCGNQALQQDVTTLIGFARIISQYQCTEGLVDLAALLCEGDGCIPIRRAGSLGAFEPALLAVCVARGLHAYAKEPQAHNECFSHADTHASW